LLDAVALSQELAGTANVRGWQVEGIGVCVCELVDLDENVVSDYTVRWSGLDVKAAFRQIAPAWIEADVRAHALAEARFGAGRGYDDFIFVGIGTGISSCLVQQGKPYGGAHGAALVLATMPVVVFDEQERRVEFSLEAFASGQGLTERYRRHRSEVTRVEEIVADAGRGNEAARFILHSGGEAMGSGLAWLVNVLDPQAVIIGGGLGLAGGLYWQSMESAARALIYADAARATPILPAACGVDAGVIGAAARVFQR
jgi:glucokinase